MLGIITVIIILVFFITNAFSVYISFIQWIIVVGALVLVAGGMLVMEYWEKMNADDDSNYVGLTHAEDYAKDWWKQRFQEKVDVVMGRETTFGEEFCGFILRRNTGGINHGREATVVVKLHPLKIVDWHDNPGPEKLADPFHGFKTIYPGAPSKVLRADESTLGIGKTAQAPGSVINIGTEKKNAWGEEEKEETA